MRQTLNRRFADATPEITAADGMLKIRLKQAKYGLVPVAVSGAVLIGVFIDIQLGSASLWLDLLITVIFVITALAWLKPLIGCDELLVDQEAIYIRQSLLGMSETDRYPLQHVRRFRFEAATGAEESRSFLYFECEYCPHDFMHGIGPEAAAAVLEAVARFAPQIMA
jgi:hypothetical protein